jgi:hypothetical protein
VFFDYYKKISLEERQFHLAFSIILKDKASNFYYDKITRRLYDFYIIVNLIRFYFKTEENH